MSWKNHDDGSRGTGDDGRGEFLGAAGHADDDAAEDVARVECVTEDVAKAHHRKDGHEAKRRDQIVGHHHHYQRHDHGDDDQGADERARIRQA